MTIVNRLCDLLHERDIPFTINLMVRDTKYEDAWEIIAHHPAPWKEQVITPDTTIAELWWLN